MGTSTFKGEYVPEEDYCESVTCETINFTPTSLGNTCSSHSELYEYNCDYFPGGLLEIDVQIENISLSSVVPEGSYIALYSGGIEVGRLSALSIQEGSITSHTFLSTSLPITINELGTLLIHQTGGISFDITKMSAIATSDCYLEDTNIDGIKPDLECFYMGPPGYLPPEENCIPVGGCKITFSEELIPDNPIQVPDVVLKNIGTITLVPNDINDILPPGHLKDGVLEGLSEEQFPTTGECNILLNDCEDI